MYFQNSPNSLQHKLLNSIKLIHKVINNIELESFLRNHFRSPRFVDSFLLGRVAAVNLLQRVSLFLPHGGKNSSLFSLFSLLQARELNSVFMSKYQKCQKE